MSSARKTRRDILRAGGASAALGLLSFSVAGCEKKLSPAAAREQAATFRVLGDEQVATVDRLADILVPGSKDAGLSHYLDHQLSAKESEQMLMIKYLGVPFPFTGFYADGLAAIDAAAKAAHDQSFSKIDELQAVNLVENMSTGGIADWNGPAAPFFFFVLRSDAVDVYYGTREGFARLGTPYMAHINPPSRWGE